MARTGYFWSVHRQLTVGFVCALLVPIAACNRRHLNVAPEVLATTSPELLDRIRADPYSYFRLTNREWTARVCEIFASDPSSQVVVQLHGDAHVEQFAFMKDAWGLDDFDDAARGPALIDIVRFLGSIDLAARRRGWSHDRHRAVDRFFHGYRQGLTDPAYRPPEPVIVRRERARTPAITYEAFLARAETLMVPMGDTPMEGVIAAMKVFDEVVRSDVRSEHAGIVDGYFRVVRAGWLRLGIGSAAMPKVLIRVAGPSSDPADDVVLEAKAVRSGAAHPCVEKTPSSPTFRIVQGSRQVGRLEHSILVAGPGLTFPEMAVQSESLHDWWIRSWDPSYHEIGIDDLQSIDDLGDIAYDAGVQLGSGALLHDAALLRRQLVSSIDEGEARLRRAADQLVRELLRGWRDLSPAGS
jgi:hypothetical protein